MLSSPIPIYSTTSTTNQRLFQEVILFLRFVAAGFCSWCFWICCSCASVAFCLYPFYRVPLGMSYTLVDVSNKSFCCLQKKNKKNQRLDLNFFYIFSVDF
jgi:hypothetical protein